MSVQEATKVTARCKELRDFWRPRDKKFKEWYKLIQMEDQLKQEKMESFVGNDARAAFNLTAGMLDSKIPHRIRPEQLDMTNLRAAANVKNAYQLFWRRVNDVYRGKGRQSFMYDLLGFLLATGWYAVFANISKDGKECQAEVWNPANVFQNYDNVLAEVCRISTLQPSEIKRLLKRNKWNIDGPITQPMDMYDYWRIDDSLKFPWNTVVIGNHLVKEVTKEDRFDRIPIFTNPCGGLPDTGIITTNKTDWKGEVGQTSLATNEKMIMQMNKWWTFMMQLVRDTAQPMTYEKTSGGATILHPQQKFVRGTHVKMGIQDDLGYVVPPPMPLELRSMQLDMEAMEQRGGVPHALYGTPQGQMTSYVMAQVAQAAHTLAKPFHTAVVDCLTDIDNFWLNMIRKHGYKPYGWELPEDLPDDAEMTASYEIRVPGDAANRATWSRMLNPGFQMSVRRIYDEFWPEVENPLDEMAVIRGESALRHPTHALITLIQSYYEQARLLKEAGDNQGSALYLKAAEMAEAQLSAAISGGAPEERQIGNRPENVPQIPRTTGGR